MTLNGEHAARSPVRQQLDRRPLSRRSLLLGVGTAAFAATAASCGCAAPPPAPGGRTSPGSWVPAGTNQLLTATAVGDARGRTTATSGVLRAWERTGAGWTNVLETNCRFGRSGIHPNRTEGDGTTPAGIFTLGTVDATAFGHFARPSGLKVPWRPITSESYWVGDSSSRWYNRWYEGTPGSNFNPRISERLRTVSGVGTSDFYGLALSIGFNTQATPGLVRRSSSTSPTSEAAAAPPPGAWRSIRRRCAGCSVGSIRSGGPTSPSAPGTGSTASSVNNCRRRSVPSPRLSLR